MADSLAALVLGAGAGTRLRPLTWLRPKVLCPVGDRPLVDWAVDRVAAVVGPEAVAVNAHHGLAQMEAHLSGRVHLSIEPEEALGTAGAVARARQWLDGRGVLVVNGDTWSDAPLAPAVDGWDGERTRVCVAGPARSLHPGARVVASLLTAADVASLEEEPSGLYEVLWRRRQEEGRLEVVSVPGQVIPCDRPADYLAANLEVSRGAPVIGEGADVRGEVLRSVVWPGAVVHAGEVLVDAVRTDGRVTVLVRGLV